MLFLRWSQVLKYPKSERPKTPSPERRKPENLGKSENSQKKCPKPEKSEKKAPKNNSIRYRKLQETPDRPEKNAEKDFCG